MRPFAEVAKQLGMPKAEPMLEFWSRFVGSWRKPNKDDDNDKRKMIKAASYLEDELAWFVVVEKLYGFEVPEAVDTASQALSDLVEYLEGMLQSPRKGGPDPDNRRQLCAAVCGYIWQRQHGKLQPYWSPLQEACEAYWHACGQVETGDAKNWEEFLDLARKEDAWELFAKHPLTPR